MKTFSIKLGGGLQLDASRLVDGCALIQGARGSGKSYLVRVIVEQTIDGGLQTIVLDPEGEFVSLREKCDLIIAGKDGDVPTETRSAKVLARRIAETGASTVVDMSGLGTDDRRAFVRIFLDTLDTLPKRLERARLVVLDEAHKYCPESGKGKAQSTEAVVTLMSQGRKRGIGAILVTQRLSKLRKDAAAEAATIFIGRTSPIDLARAQDVLGCTAKDREKLRQLKKGEFYADGPGLSKQGVAFFKSGKAKTTHPEPGTRHTMSTPPPRKVIQKLLSEFASLPPSKEDEEAASAQEARAEVRRLKKELAKAERGGGSAVDQSSIDRAVEKERAAGQKRLVAHDKRWRTFHQKGGKALSALEHYMAFIADPPELEEAVRAAHARGHAGATLPPRTDDSYHRHATPDSREPAAATSGVRRVRHTNGAAPKGGAFKRMLIAVVQHGELTRQQIGLIAGISSTSGTFSNYLSQGKQDGLWIVDGGMITATDEAHEAAGDYTPLPTGPELVDYWCNHSSVTGRAREMLRAIVDAGEDGVSRRDIGDSIGMSSSSGTFSNYLSSLRTLKLINRNEPFVAAKELRE